MENEENQSLRSLPSVDLILKTAEIQSAGRDFSLEIVTQIVREVKERVRAKIIKGEYKDIDKAFISKEMVRQTAGALEELKRPFYQKVINASGIILHTALGRAVLAPEVLAEIQEELTGYSRLQIGLGSGQRSRRDEGIEMLLQRLTGAQAATVVNNNAAATAIVLNTIAMGKEVIVSRGQLVEIGGEFRLPDVMAFSGAKMVEVGTTNKTHARDYERAITENTAALLRVHPSNYKIHGFTSEVPLEEMVQIAHKRGLILIDDVGAGSLVDMSQFGFEPEPTLRQSVAAGSYIITSSADKLIGASQGGIILGREDLIAAIRKNQFARIVRVGKLTLAALEATLKLFLDLKLALQRVPTLEMILRKPEDLKSAAEKMASRLGLANIQAEVGASPGFSQTGSGSLPDQNLATTLLVIAPKDMAAQALVEKLRQYRPPIIARIQNEQILIDPRTLLKGEDTVIVEALSQILGS
ncbi:MAG: L-seryl-tRNA(Sec) selenium transferase [Acidobacteriota bacterium]